MEDIAESCWDPKFRNALKEISDDNFNAKYESEHDLLLNHTADEAEWIPSEDILELVPDARNMNVELISQATDLNDVSKKMVEAGMVGIVIMGRTVGRFSNQNLIVLVLSNDLFVIESQDRDRGIAFLRWKLADPRIHFYTTNGVHENDFLYRHYKIDLSKVNARCCTAMHIFMMRKLQSTSVPRQHIYPELAVRTSKREAKLESFELLVEIWLNINRQDIEFNMNQMDHLWVRPLNLTAINMIKKRCVLVLPLAQSLEYNSVRDVLDSSQELYVLGHTKEDPLRKMIFNPIPTPESEKLLVSIYLQFLGGNNIVEPPRYNVRSCGLYAPTDK